MSSVKKFDPPTSIPDTETIELLRNISTEIGAGMFLFPRSDIEKAYNNACERANQIIQNYAAGDGLFQMVRRQKKREGGAA